MNVLVVDVGGSHVKVLATGRTEVRRFDSGPGLVPRRMVPGVQKITSDWAYDAISIGYPGPSSVMHRFRNRTIWGAVGSGSILKLLSGAP